MIRILGHPGSINVRKVLWTAGEAGLDFVNEGAWGETRDLRSLEFLALNPNALVPVLVDGPLVLWESNTICRYLTTKANRSDLLPTAPAARAEIEKWMDWQATELNSAWRPAFMALVRQDSLYVGSPAVERSIAQWNELMLILERRLIETGEYVTGSTFTVADIVLGLSLHRWLLTPMLRPDAPSLLDYAARLQARPAAANWFLPDVA